MTKNIPEFSIDDNVFQKLQKLKNRMGYNSNDWNSFFRH